MKKIFLILLLVTLLMTGCKNKEEKEKNQYLAMKSKLLETKKYSNIDEIPCDIIVDIKRVSEERVNYRILLQNAKVNMNNIKAIAVHNYYTEDIFPSIGLFNKKYNLSPNQKENNKIELKGKIETSEDIDNLKIQLKIMIEYYDDNNKKIDIYYNAT